MARLARRTTCYFWILFKCQYVCSFLAGVDRWQYVCWYLLLIYKGLFHRRFIFYCYDI